jgi:integrase
MPKPNRGLQVKPRTDRPGIWEVGEYRGGKWKRHRTGLGSAEEAQAARYEIERQCRVGRVFELSERLIGDTTADFIEERGPHILSQTTFNLTVRNLLSFFGGKPHSYITEETCNLYYAHRNEMFRKRQLAWNKKHDKEHPIRDITNGAVGRELRQLRAMIRRDRDMRRVASEVKVWIKTENYRKPVIPTRREVILQARKAPVGSCRRKYIIIGFYTGQRKGSVLSLRWPQVHPKHLDFNPPGTPQSNKKRPVIPMNKKLRSFLRIWRKRGTDIGPVIHRNQKPIRDIKDTPVALRHAAAVHMLINGVPLALAAQYLGNSEAVLRKHYGHLIPGYLNRAADALG